MVAVYKHPPGYPCVTMKVPWGQRSWKQGQLWLVEALIHITGCPFQALPNQEQAQSL